MFCLSVSVTRRHRLDGFPLACRAQPLLPFVARFFHTKRVFGSLCALSEQPVRFSFNKLQSRLAEVASSNSVGHTGSLLFQAAPLAGGVTLVTLDHRLRAFRFSSRPRLPGCCFWREWRSRLIPHDQPMARCYRVCRILVANTADCAGFADSANS
jgi:hypothetical protein